MTDAAGYTDTQTLYIQVKNENEVNHDPTIISNGGGDTARIDVDENTTFVTDVQTSDIVSSEANGRLVYSLQGGSDQRFFTIDSGTGVLSFREAPDFESPGDQDADNTYQVGVKVTDGAGYTDTQLITVAVKDVDEAPINIAPFIISDGAGQTATVSIPENRKLVTDVEAFDDFDSEANGGLSYSITSGDDQALFEINERTGRLSFLSAPDFERPVGADNLYSVDITVTDAGGLSDTQTINVNVTDVDEVPLGIVIEGTDGDDDLEGAGGPDTIRGLGGNDDIKGLGGNDDLVGGRGDDLIGGGAGNDKVNGTDSGGRGVNEFDILSGGAGSDTFFLGDRSGAFYVGHGFQDVASISDFAAGEDTLVLFGSAGDYTLENGNFGTAIVRSAEGASEAIAILQAVNANALNLNQFTYVH